MNTPKCKQVVGRPLLCLATLCAAAATTATAQTTIGHWNFDQGTPGAPMAPDGGGPAAIEDLSGNGYWLHAWDATYGPSWSQVGETPTGMGLSSRNVGQDNYTLDATLNSWSPLQWTIETSLRLDSLETGSGWLTFIGRDGSSHGGPESDFYLQKVGPHDTANHNTIRLNFATTSGERVVINSDFTMEANQWYGVAAVSDGTNAFLYADKLDGLGYVLVGSAAFTGAGADNALAAPNSAWTFGRGWYGGGFVDHITGNLDNIRFTEGALGPQDFIAIPEPGTYALMGGLAALGLVLLRRKRR